MTLRLAGARRENPPIVSLDEFQAHLSTFGPDIDLWPDLEREAALILLAKSEYARQIVEVERLLKGELGANDVKAPRGLADRILGAISSKKSDPDS